MQNIKIILISLLIVMMEHSLLMFPIEILLFIWLLKEYLKLKNLKKCQKN